jgi:hypothetical protein
LVHICFSNSNAIIPPTVAPVARPTGPPTISPTAPVHMRLPNHAPDVTSLSAKQFQNVSPVKEKIKIPTGRQNRKDYTISY